MSYPLSDEDSTDSDSGIRFKTASTRNKLATVTSEKRSANKDRDRYSNRRDDNQSSSRQNSHRSYRDRLRDRYDSRSRRERSRSREYKDEHRKKVHRNRSPENSLSLQRRDDEHKRSEKSNRRSKRENNSSRSRDNSHDRIHAEREKSRYCDEKATVKHSRITYKSLSDEDVKKIKKKESKYDSDNFGSTKLEKKPESRKEEYRSGATGHCRNTSPYAQSEDDSPVDSPQSDIYSRYTNSPKTITISGSEDSNNEKCGPIISPQKNKHRKSSKKVEKNIESTPLSVGTGKKYNNEHIRSALSSQNIKSEQSDDTCYGPTLPPIKLNSGCHKNVNTKTTVPLEIKKNRKFPEKLDECYGPSLPSLMKTDSDSGVKSNEKQNSKSPDISDEVQGLAMPTDLLKSNEDIAIGPALPPNLQKANSTNSIKEINQHEDCDEDIGPALPPHLQKAKSINSIKGTIENGDDDQDIEPSVGNIRRENCNETSNSSKVKQIIGPAIPAHFRAALLEEAEKNTEIIQTEEDQCESEDDVIGPLPAEYSGKNSSYTQLEERALQMKIDSLNQSNDNRTVREEWMLELPQVRAANLGLGPRQFRAKGVPDMSDRSSWTDTPQDKAKKKVEPPKIDIKKEAELKMIQDRNLEQQKMVEKHKKKKKRDKSLLDAHQEEYNKKKKKEQDSGKSERRPFNRDIDLKANRFDEAQKKSILKKAQLLDSRFSSGESKFL